MYRIAEKIFLGLTCLAMAAVIVYFMWAYFNLLFTSVPNT